MLSFAVKAHCLALSSCTALVVFPWHHKLDNKLLEVCIIFISSPEQRSQRATVLPLASASTNVGVFVEVFKT